MATKAVRGQKLANELVSLADKLEGRFRKAFLRSMLSIAEDPELQKLIRDIEAGRFTFGDAIDARLSAVRIDLAEMNEIARQAIAGSAKVTNQVMGLKGSFDVINDSVVNAAKNLSIDLSTYLRKSTQETLRQIIEDLIGSNISRSEAVRRITLEVGLLPQHAKAVSNYRRTLIAAGESRSRANQLAEAYAKRLLKYRANMISRTEVARATGIGQTEFWRQMRDQGSLPPQVNRVWITSLDERACDFCRSMNGQVASIDGGWETINGYKEYPQASHPHCRCSSGITTNRMTKTGKMGVIAKVEEIEYEYWLSKFNPNHDEKGRFSSGSSGAKKSINWDSLYGEGPSGYIPDVREELEGYLTPTAIDSIEKWTNDVKWPKQYLKDVTSEDYSDHYDVLQSRLIEAGFPEVVTITRMGTPNPSGNIRNGSAIEGWTGGNSEGTHYGMDTKVYSSKVPRKNIVGVGSLEEGEFFYTTNGVITTQLTKSYLQKHLSGKHDQSTHAGKKKGGATGASETSSASDLNDAFWKSNDAQKALPYEESRSIEEYTRTAHHNVNMYLRGKLEEDNLQYSSSKKIASSLDSAFEKTSVASSTDGVVYRGITTEARKVSDSWASKLKAGDLIEDKGFMSTSQSQEVSESFSRNGTFVGVQFVISVPKGTRVMAGSETESELVLNRGTKMKVTKVTQNESRDEQPWRVQIEMEVIQ